MIERYGEVSIWKGFRSQYPNLAREATKFIFINGDRIDVYARDTIARYNYSSKKIENFRTWDKKMPFIFCEADFRTYLASGLRSALICRGYNQSEVASQLGLSRVQVNRYLNGISPIPSYILYKMLELSKSLFSDILSE